jgi:hypothetical protein
LATATIEPTRPPEPSPTRTPEPTRRPAPAVPVGPISFSDDFSRRSGNWLECDECTVSGGEMHMGPWGISGADIQHLAICDPCGQPIYYRMGVDLTYVQGVSQPGRGFGLVLRLTNEHLLILEVSPYQSLDVFDYNFTRREWTWVNGVWSGAVRAEHGLNRVVVEAAPSTQGRVDIAIEVNGRTPLVIFNQPAEPGYVGMTLYGHSLEVVFDNFEFTELE